MNALLTLLIIFSAYGSAHAETLHLNNGNSIEGKVLERGSDDVKVDVHGVTMTYFKDEIKDIDGKPLEQKIQSVEHKKDLILKFLEVFGTRKALQENFELMIKQLPKDQADQVQQLREKVKIDEIIERLIPIYDRLFTTAELQEYIQFYSSPSGKKLTTTIPLVMQESVRVSSQYIEEKFPQGIGEEKSATK
jgi:hypothetical protein